MKINRTGKVNKKCVCGGGVQDVILHNMGRAGPTEKVALCPVSETGVLWIPLKVCPPRGKGCSPEAPSFPEDPSLLPLHSCQ